MPDSLWVMCGQLLLAVFLGILIGTERVAAGKKAGIRTFALVAMGSCLLIISGTQVDLRYLGVVNFDPMRVTAAIIQGIGFLGAGLIILRGGALQGLTTAAGLWVAAGVGIAIGFKMYALALFTAFLTLVIFTVVWRFEDWIRHHAAHVYGKNSEEEGNGNSYSQ